MSKRTNPKMKKHLQTNRNNQIQSFKKVQAVPNNTQQTKTTQKKKNQETTTKRHPQKTKQNGNIQNNQNPSKK